MIPIHIFGQRYEVPETLTILRAFEWSGFRLVPGVGCRGGFCGACGTIFRLPGDHRLYYALACQTGVQPGMTLGHIPFFPARRADYRLADRDPTGETLLDLYPELVRCYGCNTCTKACPQSIDVLGYVSAALRGDLEAVAESSFECIHCGLCVARCPAELDPPNAALLARRLYGRYLAPPARHLQDRVAEIRAGGCRDELAALMNLPPGELQARYAERQIEG